MRFPRTARGVGSLRWVFSMLAGVVLMSACGEEELYDRRCEFVIDGDGSQSPLLHFSRPAGLFVGAFELDVDSDVDGVLRYTLDGCPPDGESKEFDGRLTIDASTEVRVALFDSDEPSPPRATAAFLRMSPDVSLDSSLPVVVVETWGQEGIDEIEPRPHRPAYMLVLEPGMGGTTTLDTPPAFAGRIGMHIRGNSTAEEYPKKQYKIETWGEFDRDVDVGVLGMAAESDWVFHAPHSDKTFMRNVLMYGWSRRTGRWASETRFVEAIIHRDYERHDDGDAKIGPKDYAGVYVWMEKIKVDANRLDIEKLDSKHTAQPELSGGYVLRRDWDRTFSTMIYQDALEIVYPKSEDINEPQREYIEGYINDFEAALADPGFTDPDTGYAAYVDVEAFIDHHLMVELARNVDGYVLSTYMHKPRGGKLRMGPAWDFNGALGNADYFEASETEGWHYENPEFPADNPHGYHWYSRMFQDPAFREKYAARWQELRAGPLSTEQLMADIDAYETRLEGPAERNFDRWPILGKYVWPNDEGHEDRHSFGDEVEYLRGWLQSRVAWMDSELATQ